MQRRSQAQYNNNYDFSYRLSPPLGPPSGWADFTVTSVLGHLTTSASLHGLTHSHTGLIEFILLSQDFGEGHRAWQSCDPFQLFDAPIRTIVPEVSLIPCRDSDQLLVDKRLLCIRTCSRSPTICARKLEQQTCS